jgi:hypothetical protein
MARPTGYQGPTQGGKEEKEEEGTEEEEEKQAEEEEEEKEEEGEKKKENKKDKGSGGEVVLYPNPKLLPNRERHAGRNTAAPQRLSHLARLGERRPENPLRQACQAIPMVAQPVTHFPQVDELGKVLSAHTHRLLQLQLISAIPGRPTWPASQQMATHMAAI